MVRVDDPDGRPVRGTDRGLTIDINMIKSSIKFVLNGLLKLLGYEIRKVRRDWEPVLNPGWGDLLPPRELWVARGDTLYQFFRWTWGWHDYLIIICDMRIHDSVLELACNHGRTMLGLLVYLKPPGRYEGLDILPKQIEYAQQHIHSKFAHFNFTPAGDLYNSMYNPQGRVDPADYRFPYDDSSFDIIYAASLFTHLVPPVTANYLRQSLRVLREGGRCLYSFFLLDYYRGKGTTHWDFIEFEESLEGYDEVAVKDRNVPEAVIAYKISLIERLAAEAGLRIVRIVPGSWSGSHDVGISEQDLLVFEAV
jgi:SAM-dependent methyltransferase